MTEASEPDTKTVIDRIWEKFDQSSDPIERKELSEQAADIAGSVGNIPFLDELD